MPEQLRNFGLEQLEPFLPAPEMTPGMLPIGVVIYGGRKKVMGIGFDSENHLVVNKQSLTEKVTLNGMEKSGRVHILERYNEVIPVVAEFFATRIITETSLKHSGRALYAHITARDDKGKEKFLSITEVELLQAITGLKGGLAIFDGEGMPAEHALVVERTNVTSSAYLIFLRPKEVADGYLESAQGASTFFEMAGNEIVSQSPTPLQTKVVQAFARKVREHEIEGSPEQIAVLRTVLIAHARMAMEADDVHQQFIQKYLPELRQNVARTAMTVFFGEKKVQPVDLGFMMLSGSQDKSDSKNVSVVPELPKVLLLLKTEAMRKLRIKYGSESGGKFGSNENDFTRQIMDRYYFELLEAANRKRTDRDRLEDVVNLLEELGKTDYAKKNYFSLLRSDRQNSVMNKKYYTKETGPYATDIWNSYEVNRVDVAVLIDMVKKIVDNWILEVTKK